MEITKLEAAISQFATAVRLYFEDGDPVSIHTLAMAAGELIDRISQNRNVRSLRSSFLEAIRPEFRKQVADRLNHPRNFFKHASSGASDEKLTGFTDSHNFMAILFAAQGLAALGVDTLETKVFRGFVTLTEPHLLTVQPDPELLKPFGDVRARTPRQQKQIARDSLHFYALGKLP